MGGDLESRAGRNSRAGETSGAASTDTVATTAFVSVMDSVLEEDVTVPGTFSGCRCGPGTGVRGNWAGVPTDGELLSNPVLGFALESGCVVRGRVWGGLLRARSTLGPAC